MSETPQVTIVIPVYNEEQILRESVQELTGALANVGWSYELVLAENGSTDATLEIARTLSEEVPQVRCNSTGEPGNGNYGKALRRGILEARGELVICDEIDLCDVDFYARALPLLQAREVDFVVGSKLVEGASDERPFMRHMGTVAISAMLRVALGFRGTDTHGLKAFRHSVVAPIAERCIVDRDLFASELVVRAEREGVRIREIPIRVKEKREPSVHLLRRVPAVLHNLARLTLAIRLGRGS